MTVSANKPRPTSISPWAPVALLLVAVSVALSALASSRVPTMAAAGLGLMVALTGLGVTWAKGVPKNTVWLGVGAVLNAAVLGVALFVPGWLQPMWEMAGPAPELDSNQLVRVQADAPLDVGKALGKDEWVDAASEGIRQDDVFIRVKAAKAGDVAGQGSAARLLVHVEVRQVRPSTTLSFVGFAKGKGNSKHAPVLTDSTGRAYAFFGHYPHRFSAAFDLIPLRLDHVLVFELPPAGTERLRLAVPASAWGHDGMRRFEIKEVDRDEKPDFSKDVARYKKLLRTPPDTPPDATLGRAVFAKHCQECHTLFGVGGKTGPDLTKAKRDDLDFLVKSVVDPSAEFAEGFAPKLVITTTGRLINGIIKEQTAEAITLQATGQKVVVPVAEVEEIVPSKVSLMPTELLKPFDEHEIRSLFVYLSGKSQVLMLARPETVVHFSTYGEELNNWRRGGGVWKVERGEIVVQAADGGQPPLLTSELVVKDDFRLTLRVQPSKETGGAILLHSDVLSGTPATRIQWKADGQLAVMAGDGSPLKASKLGSASPLQADDWNQLEIVVFGEQVVVRLNGKDVGSWTGVKLPERRVIALQGSSVLGQEVRFANLDLQVMPAEPVNKGQDGG